MGIESNTLSPREGRHRGVAASISLIVGLLLMVAKFWAHNVTRSQAVFSDAMESIVNVVAASLVLAVIFYASQPADEDHPYGHGKAEYFSSAFEGGLISFAGVFIVIEAINAYFQGVRLQEIGFGMLVVMGAGLGNLLLGLYLLWVGKKRSSVALKASGRHVISDFWTSVGVVGGLLLVYLTGLQWIDTATAVAVGGLLVYSGFRLVRESMGGLLDEQSQEVLETLAEVFTRHQTVGIIQAHHVKVIRSGWYHHIDAHLVVPQFWNIEHVHERISEFEAKVIADYEFGGEMNYHLDPCRQAYCKVCDINDCPIRKAEFEKRIPVDLSQLLSTEEPEEYREK